MYFFHTHFLHDSQLSLHGLLLMSLVLLIHLLRYRHMLEINKLKEICYLQILMSLSLFQWWLNQLHLFLIMWDFYQYVETIVLDSWIPLTFLVNVKDSIETLLLKDLQYLLNLHSPFHYLTFIDNFVKIIFLHRTRDCRWTMYPFLHNYKTQSWFILNWSN